MPTVTTLSVRSHAPADKDTRVMDSNAKVCNVYCQVPLVEYFVSRVTCSGAMLSVPIDIAISLFCYYNYFSQFMDDMVSTNLLMRATSQGVKWPHRTVFPYSDGRILHSS